MPEGRPDLEMRLIAAGRALGYPATPDLVPAVLARLSKRPAPRRRRLALVAAMALVAAVVLALPGPRRAVADLLGIGGVTVTIVQELRPATTLPGWGQEVTLAAAHDAVAFDILVPDALGHPDLVTVADTTAGALVTLGYGISDGRSRLVITQMRGSAEPVVVKEAAPDAMIVAVTVGDAPGLWVAGPPHVVVLRDADGTLTDDPPRLAANTLVYSDGVRTIRIELAGTLEEALTVAALLR